MAELTEKPGGKPLNCPYGCGGKVHLLVFDLPEMQCTGCYSTWRDDGTPNFWYAPRPGGDPG